MDFDMNIYFFFFYFIIVVIVEKTFNREILRNVIKIENIRF